MKKNIMSGSAALLAALLTLSSWSAPVASAQSLWSSDTYDSRSLFADHKAQNVGDIVTIIINETSTTSSTKNNKNTKSGSQNLAAGSGIFSFLASATASQSDSFQAQGSKADNNSVSGMVTATVTQVMPNGNMVVEGSQSIWQGKDEHKITFRGVCRQDDVTASNTIPSSKVSDATVHFDGKGPLNAKQRQGILTQILNILF